MMKMAALIPAAGLGTRIQRYAQSVPKGMLRIAGVPILENTTIMLRDQMEVERIVIVVNENGGMISDYFGDGSHFGVSIEYVLNWEPQRGLSYSISMAKELIQGRFVLMLSDEYYQNTNHRDLLREWRGDALGICGIMLEQDESRIRRNYTVHLDGDRIVRLIEKPSHIGSYLMGTGTMLLSPRIFGELKDALAHERAPDFIGVLDGAVRRGGISEAVLPTRPICEYQ